MRKIKFRAWVKSTNEMIPVNSIDFENDIINVNGERLFFDEVILMEYVEKIDAYEGDILYGRDPDEFGGSFDTWRGVIKFNHRFGRLMVCDEGDHRWYEVDDYMFDKVMGNIFERKRDYYAKAYSTCSNSDCHYQELNGGDDEGDFYFCKYAGVEVGRGKDECLMEKHKRENK